MLSLSYFGIITTIGICYKLYKTPKYNNSIKFITSSYIPLKNVLDNKPIILELGVSPYGSFLKIDKDIKNIIKVKNNKEEIEYTFEDDSTLTFTKKYKSNRIICYYQRDNQMICHEDVTTFIDKYNPMCFNTDFDLLSDFKV